MTHIEIAEKCLDTYWGQSPKVIFPSRKGEEISLGWDNGSEAHKRAINWAKVNYTILKRLTWKKIYELYLITLRQE